MAHIFIEKLESRQSTQAFYGIPNLFPQFLPEIGMYQPVSLPPLPLYSWANPFGYGGYSNLWSNPINSYSSPWNGFNGILSPLRYAQALTNGFGNPSIINPLPVAPLPIPPTTVTPLPPISITLLYGISIPIAVPIYAISSPVVLPTDIVP